jgi:hypothetical protein
MNENERHIMTLIGTHVDTEQWRCPTCGREFLMTWPPNYHRTILNAGDENVIHVGSASPFTGMLDLETGEVVIEPQDPRLKPFEEFLKGRL